MRLHNEVSKKELEKHMSEFLGKITQLPPVRSRVKRAPREREVKTFKILEIKSKDILFETQVQAGTYIRKLIHDLGEKIGGAHMLELRRIKAGIFDETSLTNLYDFENAVSELKKGNETPLKELITPAEILSTILPTLQIRKDVVKKVLTGSPIFPSFLSPSSSISNLKPNDKICIFSEERFIGVYSFIGQENLTAKPEFVFN